MALTVLFMLGSFVLFYQVKTFISRARASASTFSRDNSYLFVSPLRAQANAQEKIRLTVFILNNQGLGVQGKKVSLAPKPDLVVETIAGVTDEYGKALFDISTSQKGEYYLDVSVDTLSLPQKAHLSFY